VADTDLSAPTVERARLEAERAGVAATFLTADFRDLSGVAGTFDAVITCDNALPHLLDPRDVPLALAQMRAKLRPGGLLAVTMRDFDRALADRPSVAPPVVIKSPPRRIVFRLHDWDADGAPCYTIRMFVLTEAGDGWTAQEHATRYRAITRAELSEAAQAAGLADVASPGDITIVGGQQVMTARRSR
jgi:glycine/sarcosine N-methyltransferase